MGAEYDEYRGTVVRIDEYMYGMPHASKRIVKYNPGNGITSFVYEEANKDFRFGNGALGRY